MAQVQQSDSPYLQVKSSNIAISAVLKKPLQMKEVSQGSLARSKSSDALGALSIFKRPRLAVASGTLTSHKSENVVYDGVGGTKKVLQSDLKQPFDSFWSAASTKKPVNAMKKKKLSPLAFGN